MPFHTHPLKCGGYKKTKQKGAATIPQSGNEQDTTVPEGAEDPLVQFCAVNLLVVVAIHLEEQNLQPTLGL